LSRHIKNGQVKRQDVAPTLQPLWAVVDADDTTPSLRRSSGATGLRRISAGEYAVQFNRPIRDCSTSATQIQYGAVESVVSFTNREPQLITDLANDEVGVEMIDNSAQPQDIDFNVQVVC
jgi:hypothetical protein